MFDIFPKKRIRLRYRGFAESFQAATNGTATQDQKVTVGTTIGGLAGGGVSGWSWATRGGKSVANSELATIIPNSGRKFNQLNARGWSQQTIDEVVNNPAQTSTAVNRATGNPATAYMRSDGHYVIRDNVTGNLVQMSDTNLKVGYGPGQWAPDKNIISPLIPGTVK